MSLFVIGSRLPLLMLAQEGDDPSRNLVGVRLGLGKAAAGVMEHGLRLSVLLELVHEIAHERSVEFGMLLDRQGLVAEGDDGCADPLAAPSTLP